MKTEVKLDYKIYKQLVDDANILFPPNNCFGMETNVGCESYVFEQERVLCNLGGLEILSHVKQDKPCYNYVRLNKDYFSKYKYIDCNCIDHSSCLYREGEKKRTEYNNKKQNQTLDKFNYIKTKDVGEEYSNERENYQRFCDFIKQKLKDTKQQITYNYFNINTINIDNRDIIFEPKFFVKPYKDIDKKKVNVSLGVVFVKGNDGKNYAIMCNHSGNEKIDKLKNIFRNMQNTEIINLPQIQYDAHHCTVLNKEFLQEMSEYFKNKDVDNAISELKQMQNDQDLALKTFPKLYQYRQHDVDGLKKKITDYNIQNINIDNNINYLPITDSYEFEQKDNKPKKMNCGLLIDGWKLAIDYALSNHKNISVIELEKFYNILTKQIKFFDDLKVLQMQNKDNEKKYSELFDIKKIEQLSKIVTERKRMLKKNKDGLITSTNKVDCEYIEKRKKDIIDNLNSGRAISSPTFVSENIKKEICDYFVKDDFLKIYGLEKYLINKKEPTLLDIKNIFFNNYLQEEQKISSNDFSLDNSLSNQKNMDFNKLFTRKQPFEDNKIIKKEKIEENSSIKEEEIKNTIQKEEESGDRILQENDIEIEFKKEQAIYYTPEEIIDAVIDGTLHKNTYLLSSIFNSETIKGIIDLSLSFQTGGIHSWPVFSARDNRREAMKHMAQKINDSSTRMPRNLVPDPEWFAWQLVEISKLQKRGCCSDVYNNETIKFVDNIIPNYHLNRRSGIFRVNE